MWYFPLISLRDSRQAHMYVYVCMCLYVYVHVYVFFMALMASVTSPMAFPIDFASRFPPGTHGCVCKLISLRDSRQAHMDVYVY